jgi:5-formyltetrahydrofolate cyclo-ligase
MNRDLSQEEKLAAFGQLAKKKLRERSKATRRALPPAAVQARSGRIVELLQRLGPVRAARAVASFWPMTGRSEVDLRAFDRWLAERGVARYYPFMDPKGSGFVTGFRRIEGSEDLQERGQKFAEPPRDAAIAQRGDLDVVIVPALAVTPDGHRLGYGRGFYDATLPDVAPPALTIVVAFSFQLAGELYVEPHDVRCDLVVTDSELCDERGLLVGPADEPSI